MCGLTGFFTTDSTRKRGDLLGIARRMTDSLRHRGPDAGDVWEDPSNGLFLGHRRLSIIDLSKDGAQPMASPSNRYVIAYNGEIYNYMPLRQKLEAAGLKFRSRSDTEVLLGAIEHLGLNQALQAINGMFAFALWDNKTQTLHFARDRLGKKPLYIGWAGKTLIFGSELKALRSHPDFKAHLNPDSLSLYMRNGFIAAPHCIYRGVWTLPAGHRLSVQTQPLVLGENLAAVMERYWDHRESMESARGRMEKSITDADATQEFNEILEQCVSDRFMSDVPLGAFLSGGIDSSAVVAIMQSLSQRPVKTYTIGFDESGFDEARHAKKIAAHLGTEHHELYLKPEDALNLIPRLPDVYDEPFGDVSGIPTYLVSQFARHDVTVALSGDGGDEMLGGYTRHLAGPKIWDRIGWAPAPLRKVLARAMTAIPPERWDRLKPGKPLFGSGIHKAASVMALSSQEKMYERLLAQGADSLLAEPHIPETFITGTMMKAPDTLAFAEKMMYWDTLSYLPDNILVKVDRASMAHSLEVRAPLLDRRIYEYAWSLPLSMKIREGKGKYLLRQVLKKYMPENLYDRPKQGFNMPAGEWLRGPLRDWAESLLTPDQLEYFNIKAVQDLWSEHLRDQGNHAGPLWTLMMFQAWRKQWL